MVFEVISPKKGGMRVLLYTALFPQVRVCQWAPAVVGIKNHRCGIVIVSGVFSVELLSGD